MRDRHDERMLELLARELAEVQALKQDSEAQIALLLEEQKRLEIMERREKTQEAQTAAQSTRLSRIEQLQEQERVRREQLEAARVREEQARLAREEEARQKQANSIETHGLDDDLDDFLAQESSYY